MSEPPTVMWTYRLAYFMVRCTEIVFLFFMCFYSYFFLFFLYMITFTTVNVMPTQCPEDSYQI